MNQNTEKLAEVAQLQARAAFAEEYNEKLQKRLRNLNQQFNTQTERAQALETRLNGEVERISLNTSQKTYKLQLQSKRQKTALKELAEVAQRLANDKQQMQQQWLVVSEENSKYKNRNRQLEDRIGQLRQLYLQATDQSAVLLANSQSAADMTLLSKLATPDLLQQSEPESGFPGPSTSQQLSMQLYTSGNVNDSQRRQLSAAIEYTKRIELLETQLRKEKCNNDKQGQQLQAVQQELKATKRQNREDEKQWYKRVEGCLRRLHFMSIKLAEQEQKMDSKDKYIQQLEKRLLVLGNEKKHSQGGKNQKQKQGDKTWIGAQNIQGNETHTKIFRSNSGSSLQLRSPQTTAMTLQGISERLKAYRGHIQFEIQRRSRSQFIPKQVDDIDKLNDMAQLSVNSLTDIKRQLNKRNKQDNIVQQNIDDSNHLLLQNRAASVPQNNQLLQPTQEQSASNYYLYDRKAINNLRQSICSSVSSTEARETRALDDILNKFGVTTISTGYMSNKPNDMSNLTPQSSFISLMSQNQGNIDEPVGFNGSNVAHGQAVNTHAGSPNLETIADMKLHPRSQEQNQISDAYNRIPDIKVDACSEFDDEQDYMAECQQIYDYMQNRLQNQLYQAKKTYEQQNQSYQDDGSRRNSQSSSQVVGSDRYGRPSTLRLISVTNQQHSQLEFSDAQNNQIFNNNSGSDISAVEKYDVDQTKQPNAQNVAERDAKLGYQNNNGEKQFPVADSYDLGQNQTNATGSFKQHEENRQQEDAQNLRMQIESLGPVVENRNKLLSPDQSAIYTQNDQEQDALRSPQTDLRRRSSTSNPTRSVLGYNESS